MGGGTVASMLVRVCIGALVIAALVCADVSPRTTVSASDSQIQAIAKFATTEIRKLCKHCHWHMKVSYENFELVSVLSAAKGPPAFGNGTNYYLNLELETKGPGYYRGKHDVYVFTGAKDEYKSLALDEFPQMEKPFLGDRIKMEKDWNQQGKKSLLELQLEKEPWVGTGPGPALKVDGPGHVLTAAKHSASHSELKQHDEL